MANVKKILAALLIFTCLSTASTEETDSKSGTPATKIVEEEELIESESKDGKLEIIKRIKKVNPDGSYTIGYEADDGSFKIESRDVLGNIKGTYGFLDDEGAIKRISYSSSNVTDIFSKQPPSTTSLPSFQSVVQRIPKTDKVFTTAKSSTYSPVTTTSSPTTSLSVIQSIARRRASSTTAKPNYHGIETIKSSSRPDSVIYTSAAPRVLLQRPSTAASIKLHNGETKSEGQIIRPEVIGKPTEIPVFRTLHAKHYEDEKPVTEDASEVRPNILRRQLPQVSRDSSFNPEQHVYNLKQSLGHNDVSDVFNSGHTVTSRPLFTTTRSTRIVSTPASPVTIPVPTANYVANYQKNEPQEVDTNTASYSHPVGEIATSTEAASTSTNTPVVQIPANRASTPEPLVAIRHPFQQGAILVPLSQLQNNIIPVDNMQEVYNARRYYPSNSQPPTVEVERVNVRKVHQHSLRPLPVHVDENGYLREMPRHIPTPYPIPVPVTPFPVQARAVTVAPAKHINDDINNDIENIQPPVSTREFQTLLNHLIIRQKRLEKISELTNPKLHPELYQREPQRYQRVILAPSPPPQQYVVQRGMRQEYEPQRASGREYFSVRAPETAATSKTYTYSNRNDDEPKRVVTSYERRFVDTRRTGRLIPVRDSDQRTNYYQDESESQREEYLPADVRETLLLRMLQLAMNPALPVEEEEEAQQVATVNTPEYRRSPAVRNVEILGEELGEEGDEPERKGTSVSRTKRYKDEDMEYME